MDLDDAARKQLESLGGFIRERRTQAQYSLRDLADRANVSNPYLSQIERGLHEPSVRVLKAIAGALNMSAESLLQQAGMLEGREPADRALGASGLVTGLALHFGGRTSEANIVWTAGVKANPVLQNSDLPLDKMGRVTCNAALQVVDAEGTVVADAYAAGDCAAVPDLYNPGQFCPPNAQHALREGNHLGDNLARVLRSAEVTEYKHKNIGAVASLGMYKGVAQMFGRIKVAKTVKVNYDLLLKS